MKFKLEIEIEMDNAAFEEPLTELRAILGNIKLERLFSDDWTEALIDCPKQVRDSNGNSVGYMVIED